MGRKNWGRDPRCWIVYSGIIGVAMGAVITWWVNRPWIQFEYLQATYRLETSEISLQGYYKVNRECDGPDLLEVLLAWASNMAPLPSTEAVWRNEALATDGQVALYGPVPEPPVMTKGSHRLVMKIPLLKEIYPDGWHSSARAYCAGEHPETVVSPLAKVIILNEEETPP